MIIFLLVLAILCAAISAACWCSEDMDEGAKALGSVLFAGIAALLAWVAIR